MVHLLDPFTLQAVDLQPLAYWKTPFKAALSRDALTEFVVLDAELRDPEWRSAFAPCNQRVISVQSACDQRVISV